MTTTTTSPAPAELDDDTPVGIPEIAERLDVRQNTVSQWKLSQATFPPAEPTRVGGSPWWRWGAIRQWATDTGRLAP